MASSSCNSFSEPAIMEQIITEFFTKSVHIILESRSPYVSSRNYSGEQFISSPSPSSSSSSSSVRPRHQWFNLALGDCPAALENFDLWRQSNLEPLVIDVVLTRRPSRQHHVLQSPNSSRDQFSNWTSGRDEFLQDSKSEKIVERWIIQYESRSNGSVVRESGPGAKKGSGGNSQSSELSAMYKKTYKKSIIMLRSLYAMVKLLPAYKVFRDLNSSGQIRPLSLSHRISSFAESFTREEAEMGQFGFTPVDTPCGRLTLSVSYLMKLDDIRSETSTPLPTQFIPDYVGSPTTDPLRRFHSLPSSLPAYASFSRRHSWSNDHGATPVSQSPSPTYSNACVFRANPNPRLPPHNHLRDNAPSACSVPNNASTVHRKNTSFDEYWPSPPFSPSSSPCPPTQFCNDHPQNPLLRTESAPVNIPLPRHGKNYLQNQGLPPSPSKARCVKPGCSPRVDAKTHISTSSIAHTSSPEGKLQAKKELFRMGDFHTDIMLHKALSFSKDETGSLSGLKISSCTSPRLPCSRSSSRLSFLDEFDDSEFPCPFAVDEDIIDSGNRIERLDRQGQTADYLDSTGLLTARKSQEAAVSAIVKMLKNAPPLRPEPSRQHVIKDETRNTSMERNTDTEVMANPNNSASVAGMTTSEFIRSRTVADAFEELRGFKERKELLLQQIDSQISESPSKDS
ncbi:putative HORMA domain superfamily protein [Dioscorea sansibarensis]